MFDVVCPYFRELDSCHVLWLSTADSDHEKHILVTHLPSQSYTQNGVSSINMGGSISDELSIPNGIPPLDQSRFVHVGKSWTTPSTWWKPSTKEKKHKCKTQVVDVHLHNLSNIFFAKRNQRNHSANLKYRHICWGKFYSFSYHLFHAVGCIIIVSPNGWCHIVFTAKDSWFRTLGFFHDQSKGVPKLTLKNPQKNHGFLLISKKDSTNDFRNPKISPVDFSVEKFAGLPNNPLLRIPSDTLEGLISKLLRLKVVSNHVVWCQ